MCVTSITTLQLVGYHLVAFALGWFTGGLIPQPGTQHTRPTAIYRPVGSFTVLAALWVMLGAVGWVAWTLIRLVGCLGISIPTRLAIAAAALAGGVLSVFLRRVDETHRRRLLCEARAQSLLHVLAGSYGITGDPDLIEIPRLRLPRGVPLEETAMRMVHAWLEVEATRTGIEAPSLPAIERELSLARTGTLTSEGR